MNDDWNEYLKRTREEAKQRGIEIAGLGIHTHRLDPRADNLREVAFATQWQREHEHSDLLQALFAMPCVYGGKVKFPLGDMPTERDRKVAATVVQWLGSNVGFSFLSEALKQCGYRIEQVRT